MRHCVTAVLLCFLLILPLSSARAEEVITFPDPNFEQFVREAIGKETGDIYASDVQTGFLTLDVSGRDIADLTGLEYFTGTRMLYCETNRLTALDLSKNPLLEVVACGFNQLTSLDVSHNPALAYLSCYQNLLTTLDVSQNPQLKHLDCAKNYMASESDIVGLNRFVTTDFGFLPQHAPFIVTFLGWNDAVLAEVTVLPGGTARAPEPPVRAGYAFVGWDRPIDGVTGDLLVRAVYEPLEVFSAPDPQFEAAVRAAIRQPFGSISMTDVRTLTELDLSGCDITDLTGIEHFTALRRLDCSINRLTALDVSRNAALTELFCGGNLLTALDVRQNGALAVLSCDANQLTALDVGQNAALTDLSCAANRLTALDVRQNPLLVALACQRNQLTVLDVSRNTALARLNCDENGLGRLLLTENAALVMLSCQANQLTELDLTRNTALETLYCGSNQLTALDLTHNESLHLLDCDDNQLTALDVTAALRLDALFCRENQLRALDVSRNTLLQVLSCGANQLTALTLPQSSRLLTIRCEDNKLTALDVSRSRDLTELQCQGNELTALDVTNNKLLYHLDCSRNYLPFRTAVTGLNTAVTVQFYFDPQREALPPNNGGGWTSDASPPTGGGGEAGKEITLTPDFDDVPRTHWAAAYIYLLRDACIVNGVGGGLFQPAARVTRASFVKMLAGIAGADLSQYSGSVFDDVAPDAWYAPHVAWAAELGVTTGVPGGGFAPDAPITRQDLAVMLARFVQAIQFELPQNDETDDFTDADEIAPYAEDAVRIIRRAGILSGYPDGSFGPRNPAGRDETCKLLAMLYEQLSR